MKAITLHQPWASLIAHGVKTIETRSWMPSWSAVGRPLAIHAGKRVARAEALHPDTLAAIVGLYGQDWRNDIPVGAVVAIARLSGAYQVVRDTGDGRVIAARSGVGRAEVWPVDSHGDFSPGRWLWILEDVRRVEPVAAIGRQGLWDWPGGEAL